MLETIPGTAGMFIHMAAQTVELLGNFTKCSRNDMLETSPGTAVVLRHMATQDFGVAGKFPKVQVE